MFESIKQWKRIILEYNMKLNKQEWCNNLNQLKNHVQKVGWWIKL